MNATEKKSLLGSALLHGAVIGIFTLASLGFMSKKDKEVSDLQILNVINPAELAKLLTDGPTTGGGAAVAGSAHPPEAVQPAREPAPVQPQPKPLPEPMPAPQREARSRPEAKPEAIKPPPSARTVRNNALSQLPKDPPKKPPRKKVEPKKREIDLSKTETRNFADQTEDRERARRQAADKAAHQQAESQRRDLLDSIRSGITRVATGTASGVSVQFTGGGGGQAAINYGEYIVAEFKRAWSVPATATTSMLAKATVTIASDGRVTDARIIGRSGNSAFDKSVETVLRNVRRVPGFPAGASSEPRTYTIHFQPRSSQGNG